MSGATRWAALATRIGQELKAMRTNGETVPTSGTTGHVLTKTASGAAFQAPTGGGSGTAISALTAGTSPAPNAALVPGVQAGSTRRYSVADIRRHIPFEFLIFHLGATAVYTLSPLTAGTVEPANAPMARIFGDLSSATEMRLLIGMRTLGVGATTCDARMQYSTNGATQGTWADMGFAGAGAVSLHGGTANALRVGAWTPLVAGAVANDLYMRLVLVTTGTLTTAPTLSWAAVMFR